MKPVSDALRLATKETITVRKWTGPKSGEPDEVVTHEVWRDRDGSIVSDPARIAELEAGVPGKDAV